MKYWFKLLCLLFYFSSINTPCTFGYRYEVKTVGDHIIHITTIAPKEFDIEFVKAHNYVCGRETVTTMAERSNAIIAMNAGFFEIGKASDGMASGTLVINSKIYGLKSGEHSVLSYSTKKGLEIKKIDFLNNLVIEKSIIRLLKVNSPPLRNEIVLFTYAYGTHSLTKFSGRYEISFDQFGKIVEVYSHGNCPIPNKGFVVSMPCNKDLFKIDKSKIKLRLDPLLCHNEGLNLIHVIPVLVQEGKVAVDLFSKKSGFYTDRNARTAIGIRSNGEVILVVVENCYKKDLASITLREVKYLLTKNAVQYCFQYKKLDLRKLSLDELLRIVRKEFASDANVKGFTILELANFMKDLGCVSAANLDGGGSSTLWINGKVKNRIIGDKDEAIGELGERPISDAIVFIKK